MTFLSCCRPNRGLRGSLTFVVVTELYEENYPVCWTTSLRAAPLPPAPASGRRESGILGGPPGSTPASPGPRPHHWGQADHLRGLPAISCPATSAAASVHLSLHRLSTDRQTRSTGARGNWEHGTPGRPGVQRGPGRRSLGVSQEVKSRDRSSDGSNHHLNVPQHGTKRRACFARTGRGVGWGQEPFAKRKTEK